MLEIIHVNGCYKPEQQMNEPPEGSSELYYAFLGEMVDQHIADGGDVVYRLNMGTVNTDRDLKDDLETAISIDPLLNNLNHRAKVKVMPDGLSVDTQKIHEVEDEVVGSFGRIVLVGAYLEACVASIRNDIRSRNGATAAIRVSIDEEYSLSTYAPSGVEADIELQALQHGLVHEALCAAKDEESYFVSNHSKGGGHVDS